MYPPRQTQPFALAARLRALLLAALAGSLPVTGLAQTTWISTNTSDWTNKNNWSPKTANGGPTTTTPVEFGTTGTQTAPSIGVTGAAGSITFISGALAYDITGAGTLTVGSGGSNGITNLAANNQIFSVANIALGVSQSWSVASTGNLSFSSNVSLGANTLSLLGSSSGVGSISGIISGTGGLTKSGSGTWTLSGSNTFSGAANVNAGTLAITGDAALGTTGGATNVASGALLDFQNVTYSTAESITINGGTLAASTGTSSLAGSIALGTGGATVSVDGAQLTLSGAITGANALTKTGAGTLVVSNSSSSYTGTTSVDAGTLAVAANNALGAAAGSTTVASGATLDFRNVNYSTAESVTLNGGILATSTGISSLTGAIALGTGISNIRVDGTQLTLSGQVSGSTALTKTGAGTLVLSGNNIYSGGTALNAGTLNLGSANAIGTSGTISFDGGTLQHSAANTTDYSNRFSNAASQQYRIDTNGQNVTLASNLTSAGGSLTKTGTGDLVLTGINSYSGGTTVSAGTLHGTTASLQGSIVNNASLAFWEFTNGTFGGTISGSGDLLKYGGASLALSGSNSYSGNTTIFQGAIVASHAGALGTGGGTTTVNSGASLVLDGGITLSSETQLNLAGVGVSNVGALLNFSGANAWEGNVALIDHTSVQSWGGTLRIGEGTTFSNTLALGSFQLWLMPGAGTEITVNSQVQGAGAVVVSGNGTVTLAGNSSYDGGTAVLAGTLAVTANNALGSTVAGTTVSSGATLDLRNVTYSTAEAVTVDGGTVATSTGTSSFAGGVALGTSGGTVDIGGTQLTMSGQLSGSTDLAKTGAGTLVLSGNSSGFTGGVDVTSGILLVQHANALGTGTAGTTVSSGATLQLDGGVISAFNGTLTLSGTGAAGAGGALVGSGGDNRWNNNLALAADATVHNTAGGFLALGELLTGSTLYDRGADPIGPPSDPTTFALGGHTLTLTGTGPIYLNARLTGAGSLTVDMNSTADEAWFTSNMNTFTGTTWIKNGTLVPYTTSNTVPNDPANPNFFGIYGPIVIGDGSGAANSAVLSILDHGTTTTELISFNSPITINSDGLFSVGSVQSIGALTFNGGRIDVGNEGGLYLNDTVTVNDGTTSVIDGVGNTLSLTIHKLGSDPAPNANRIFDTLGTGSLAINATVYLGSITKNGTGTLTLTGDNGYEGTTTINDGIVNIRHANALGQGLANDASSTTVNGDGVANGTLQLQGGISVGLEKLTLNNTGFNNNGALQNVSDNNVWTGQVVVNDARVQSDSGLLTLGGNVNINTALEVRGVSDTTISGPISGPGTITKNDTGTLIISGNNTFGGTTTINEGIVSLQHNAGLGSGLAGTTVTGNGGALELNNAANGNLTTTGEPLFLNGTGISGTGALRNAAGTNTFAGLVTLQSASLITANSGTTLTLSGGTSATTQALTIGTAAQNGDITITGAISNGSGSLTKDGSGTFTFQRITNGITNGTVGQTHIAGGTMRVGDGVASHVTNLTTGELSSAINTTLIIGSGSTVTSVFDNGAISQFDGIIGSTSGGTLALTSAAGSASGLEFNTTFTASNLTLKLGGATIGSENFDDYFRLVLSSVDIEVGTIHITGDTILDFTNSANTFLTSATLIIDEGVKVSVHGWSSLTTVWYATNTVSGVDTLPGDDVFGGPVLDQINFENHNGNNYDGLTTTWVEGTGQGWLDREIRPTPEPATYGAILLGGAIGLLGWRRFRGRKTAEC